MNQNINDASKNCHVPPKENYVSNVGKVGKEKDNKIYKEKYLRDESTAGAREQGLEQKSIPPKIMNPN